MMDSFRPLKVAKPALAIEDPDYHKSLARRAARAVQSADDVSVDRRVADRWLAAKTIATEERPARRSRASVGRRIRRAVRRMADRRPTPIWTPSPSASRGRT